MEKMKGFFDEFFFDTGITPVCIIAVPFVLIALYQGTIKDVENLGFITYAIVIILLIVMAKIGREIGKKYEAIMFKELGEKPTTIVMRYSDHRIDEHTKTRYHEKLNELISELNLPLSKEEEKEDADELYQSAINWLRTNRGNDTTKYRAAYRALKDYNFWRNLLGLKYLAITLYGLFAVRELYTLQKFDFQKLFLNPFPEYFAFLVFIISAILVRLFVDMKVVKRKAFDYAVALIESCDIQSE